MKRAPRIIRRGTPAEVATHAAGFSANGESQFSRRSAQGQVAEPKRPRSRAEAVQQNATRIGRLHAMLKVENNSQLRLRLMRELREREMIPQADAASGDLASSVAR